jgi:hypothetical protein
VIPLWSVEGPQRIRFTGDGKRRSCRYETDGPGDMNGHAGDGITLADPNDRGMLDVVGFDMTVPAVIADFVRE